MRTASGPVLLSDPRIAAIDWADDGEPLVDVRGALRLDRRQADPAEAYALLRRGVVERLHDAQALLPEAFRLLIIEGYRPPELQREYFENLRIRVAAAHPGWDAARCRLEASRFVSPPEVAPHSTGGAVDLTLCTADGVELDLGTAVNAYDDGTAASRAACATDASGLTVAARRNRDLLSRVLSTVGLVNYPTEWWHWSYGDRYWALAHGGQRSRYGPVGTGSLGNVESHWAGDRGRP